MSEGIAQRAWGREQRELNAEVGMPKAEGGRWEVEKMREEG